MSAPIVGACGDTIRTNAIHGAGMTPHLICIEIADGDLASVYLTPNKAIAHIEAVEAALAKIGYRL